MNKSSAFPIVDLSCALPVQAYQLPSIRASPALQRVLDPSTPIASILDPFGDKAAAQPIIVPRSKAAPLRLKLHDGEGEGEGAGGGGDWGAGEEQAAVGAAASRAGSPDGVGDEVGQGVGCERGDSRAVGRSVRAWACASTITSCW